MNRYLKKRIKFFNLRNLPNEALAYDSEPSYILSDLIEKEDGDIYL